MKNDSEKEAFSPMPSAPPQPPPLPDSFSPSFRLPQMAVPGSYPANYACCAGQPHSLVPWSTGLCDCCNDIPICCLTCWCPCITFGRIAEIVDQGTTSCGFSTAVYMLIMSVTGLSCLYSCFYRSKMRGQFFLEESFCNDCFIHCLCEQCALCQEYRQLQHQGFDMSFGWHGNVERQKRIVAAGMPPSLGHVHGMIR